MDEVLSLDALHDIVLPPAPPLWPPGDGFWIVLLLLLVFAALAWRWRRQRRRRNAYRVAGLELLRKAKSVYDVSIVLKRVALAAWPREQVAPLQGVEWVQFLNGACRRARFDEDALSQPDSEAGKKLLSKAARWIRSHRAHDTGQGGTA